MNLADWNKSANPGESIVYYSGSLAEDSRAKEVRTAAQRLAEKGEVCLTQRRKPKSKFDYIATKTKYSNPRITWPNYLTAGHYEKKPVMK